MMHHPQYLISDEQSLDNAGVHVTAVRLMVWRHVRHHFHDAFNLQDLMEALPRKPCPLSTAPPSSAR